MVKELCWACSQLSYFSMNLYEKNFATVPRAGAYRWLNGSVNWWYLFAHTEGGGVIKVKLFRGFQNIQPLFVRTFLDILLFVTGSYKCHHTF